MDLEKKQEDNTIKYTKLQTDFLNKEVELSNTKQELIIFKKQRLFFDWKLISSEMNLKIKFNNSKLKNKFKDISAQELKSREIIQEDFAIILNKVKEL